MTTPTGVAADVPSDVDKRGLWPMWAKRFEWQDKLYKRAAHKSLDIPDDDMQINKTNVGIGTIGAMGIAAVAGLPASLVALALMVGGNDSQPQSQAAPTPTTVAPNPLADSNYSVLFWELDEKGNKVRQVLVPPINQVEPIK